MCNVMVDYFKRNKKVQRNVRQRRSEQDNPSILKQEYWNMSREIRF